MPTTYCFVSVAKRIIKTTPREIEYKVIVRGATDGRVLERRMLPEGLNIEKLVPYVAEIVSNESQIDFQGISPDEQREFTRAVLDYRMDQDSKMIR